MRGDEGGREERAPAAEARPRTSGACASAAATLKRLTQNGKRRDQQSARQVRARRRRRSPCRFTSARDSSTAPRRSWRLVATCASRRSRRTGRSQPAQSSPAVRLRRCRRSSSSERETSGACVASEFAADGWKVAGVARSEETIRLFELDVPGSVGVIADAADAVGGRAGLPRHRRSRSRRECDHDEPGLRRADPRSASECARGLRRQSAAGDLQRAERRRPRARRAGPRNA